VERPGTDQRLAARFVVDALVTPDQVDLLEMLLAQAMCAGPDDHPGPCRVAWRITRAVERPADGSQPLPDAVARSVRQAIGSLEVLPSDAATRAIAADLL
jgi:hypothetical protein